MESASTTENSILLGVTLVHFAGLTARMTFPTTWWVVPSGREVSSIGPSTLSHPCCILASVLVNRMLRRHLLSTDNLLTSHCPIRRVIMRGFLVNKTSSSISSRSRVSSASLGKGLFRFGCAVGQLSVVADIFPGARVVQG